MHHSFPRAAGRKAVSAAEDAKSASRPPKHTVVVSIDEKSQIQALDRTHPGLPLKPGKCGTMTHD